MISKEQIAHELAMTYLNNRYGMDVTGDFNVSSSNNEVTGYGGVVTNHFPNTNEPKIVKVGTGEKGILGFEKKEKVQSGYLVDDIFKNMVEDYHNAYLCFFKLLQDK